MHRDIKKILICLIASVIVIAATATTALAAPPDFKELKAQNPDIYAWLYIPGTDINYPVCQSTNDVYYLTHNTQGQLDANGALYTESKYNTRTFQDAVTVIYGHNMRSGKMFGFLEETFREGFTGRSEAIVYLPAIGNTPPREQHYELFAALPVGSSHYTFRKEGCRPITIPKHEPIKKIYVERVKRIVEEEESNEKNT